MFVLYILGVVALALVGTLQLVKILQTRNVDGLSLPAYLMLLFGVATLLVRAVEIHDPVFVATNAYALVSNSANAFFIWLWRGRETVEMSVHTHIPELGKMGECLCCRIIEE